MDAEPIDVLDGAELIDWRALPPGRRRAWWQALWSDAIALAERYRLALRSGWWQDPIQVEALAAFCCWLRLYDTGAESDPTGKLQLLWELERLRGVLRAGERPFDPAGDRAAFERHIANLHHPAGSDTLTTAPGRPDWRAEDRAQLSAELDAVTERVSELTERERLLAGHSGRPRNHRRAAPPAQLELDELRKTIAQLARRAGELRNQLDQFTRRD